jgi:hypothetical protein
MNIEYKRFKAIATELGVESLSKDEAEAIVSIARLAVDADRHEDEDELKLYDILSGHVCALAGISPDSIQSSEAKKPRGDDDRKARMLADADKLKTRGPRELAYAVAYLTAISDLDIQPVESKFLDSLLEALAIDDEREHEIAGAVNDAVVPD